MSENEVQIPPFLKPGDTIGITALSAGILYSQLHHCIDRFKHWGFDVRVGHSIVRDRFISNYLGADDTKKIEDFQEMVNDQSIKAIMCCRGGYGLSRIIDQLDLSALTRIPKWIMGYSDVTLLHSHLFSRYKIASLHCATESSFGPYADPQSLSSLFKNLIGTDQRINCHSHPLNIKGTAEGKLYGGNLTLLTHSIGTCSMPADQSLLLFTEEINEPLYKIDRMLIQLKRSELFPKIKGFIFGSFINCDTNLSSYLMIRNTLADAGIPMCFGFPVGHQRYNYALKHGCTYKLEIGSLSTVLKQII